jgi:cell division septation protein DedD
MNTDRGTGGRSAFFGLAMLILGGLLFAAGVMVGRQMALDEAQKKSRDSLTRIDQRDKERKETVDGGALVFPEVLDSEKPDSRPKLAPARAPAAERSAAAPVVVPAPETAPSQLNTLQVAAYGDRSQAESLVKKLTGQGYKNPHIAEREVPPKGTYYRVRVGPFSSKQEAERAKEILEKDLRVKVMFVRED